MSCILKYPIQLLVNSSLSLLLASQICICYYILITARHMVDYLQITAE